MMEKKLAVEELVKALRLCTKKTENGETCITGQKDCPFGVTVLDCTERMNLAASFMLESLAAERDRYKEQLAAALAENTKLAVHAHWAREKEQDGSVFYKCSHCGQVVSMIYPKNWHACPYCTALMEAGETE